MWSSDYRRLLELASIVKVDVLDQPAAKLDAIAQQLAPYDVCLLAERVETADVRALCAGLGYELFQGYYYARPEMVKNRALVSDDLAIARAMSVLRDDRASDADAEAAFSADARVVDGGPRDADRFRERCLRDFYSPRSVQLVPQRPDTDAE